MKKNYIYQHFSLLKYKKRLIIKKLLQKETFRKVISYYYLFLYYFMNFAQQFYNKL